MQESRRSSVRADGRCVTPPWHITRCGHRRYQVRPPSKPGFHVALLDSSGKTNRRGRDMDRVDVPGSGVSLSLDSQARTGWPGDGWVKFFRYGAIVVGPRVHPWCGIPFRGHFWWNRRKRRLQALPMQAVLRTPAPPRMSGSPPRQASANRADLLFWAPESWAASGRLAAAHARGSSRRPDQCLLTGLAFGVPGLSLRPACAARRLRIRPPVPGPCRSARYRSAPGRHRQRSSSGRLRRSSRRRRR